MRTRVLVLVASIFALSTALTLSAESSSGNNIDITAVPSTFTPNHVILHVGQTTTLHFSHTEGVHSIASSDLGIDSTIISAGKDVAVSVTPQKAGTFVLHCGVVCGADHDNMSLTVTVEQ